MKKLLLADLRIKALNFSQDMESGHISKGEHKLLPEENKCDLSIKELKREEEIAITIPTVEIDLHIRAGVCYPCRDNDDLGKKAIAYKLGRDIGKYLISCKYDGVFIPRQGYSCNPFLITHFFAGMIKEIRIFAYLYIPYLSGIYRVDTQYVSENVPKWIDLFSNYTTNVVIWQEGIKVKKLAESL